MSLLLAIDQSTSATKAIVFDRLGHVLAQAARDHRQIYPQPGWVEHDAEEIWTNVLAVVRAALAQAPALAARVAGLSIANQRETILVWDRASGKPLHPAIVWQCRRGDALCGELKAAGHEELVRRKTGLRVDTYFSASKLRWLIDEQPEIGARLRDGTALLGTIDAFLIYRLTQGGVFATDYTNASRTLLFDVRALRWDEQLCALFHVPSRALPEVRESAAQFGETDAGGLLPRRVPIVGVMGDSQASLFAQRCYAPGMAKATFGTGTSVLLNVGHDWKATDRGGVTALAWVWQGRPTYAFEGLINFSAATISWLKNQLGLIEDAAEVESLARAVPDNGGVYFVPAFAGLGAPHWSADARAAIVGMTAFTRREHIVRAAQEAIAYQIRDVLEMMRADGGVPLRKVHADGGPTRNAFLMQFTADLTGMELSVSEVAESSAWGAALNGMLGLGWHRSLDELAALPRDAQGYLPHMAAAQAKQLHDGWLAAVRRVL